MAEQLRIFGIPVVSADGMPVDQVAIFADMPIPEQPTEDEARIIALLKNLAPPITEEAV